MTPNELNKIIHASKIILKQRGGSKTHEIVEVDSTRSFAFASVVAKDNLLKGTVLNKNNITVKRPGTGDFNASQLSDLYGKKVIKTIKINTQLKRQDIE